jgi:hypothetical protein
VTFDPTLAPERCAACAQQVVKHDGRCPICATRAEQARAAARPAVAAGPWPRLRGADLDLRIATVVETPELRLEPTPDARGVVVTPLGPGVTKDGVALAPGQRAVVARGARLGFAGREAVIA